MSSPPRTSVPVVLGLGLGGGASGQVGKPPPPPSPSMGAFTFMQLQELQQQALIYKYMSSGLPVPLHLVLPIWKSVASSGAGYYPAAFMMGFKFDMGLLGGFDYKNLMEPEPGRCRRTDGKKWRCSRDVVPDHKYCDKHLHRGRNRSRKHVEQQEASASAAAAAVVTTRDAAAFTGNENNKVNNGVAKPPGVTLAAANGTTTALANNDAYSRKQASSQSSPVMRVPPTSLQLMPPTPHCSTTNTGVAAVNTSAASGYGGGINSIGTLSSYSSPNNNSDNAANLFNPASPPQMFGFSPTSILLGSRTTSGISYS